MQKHKNAPNVGIIFLVGKTLLIDRTPVSEGEINGDFRIHERGHDTFWKMLKKAGAVPSYSEYDNYPRGRVAYNDKTRKYTLLADKCILGKKILVAKIVSRLHLPPKNTETGTDSHYRCFRCLSRGG